MILCLWSPLHPLSKLLAIQDHTQNLEEQLWMGGKREVSIIFYRPVTRSDLKQERSFFRGSVSSFLQLVVAERCLVDRARFFFAISLVFNRHFPGNCPRLTVATVLRATSLTFLFFFFLPSVFYNYFSCFIQDFMFSSRFLNHSSLLVGVCLL